MNYQTKKNDGSYKDSIIILSVTPEAWFAAVGFCLVKRETREEL